MTPLSAASSGCTWMLLSKVNRSRPVSHRPLPRRRQGTFPNTSDPTHKPAIRLVPIQVRLHPVLSSRVLTAAPAVCEWWTSASSKRLHQANRRTRWLFSLLSRVGTRAALPGSRRERTHPLLTAVANLTTGEVRARVTVYVLVVSRVHVVAESTATPGRVLEAARDFSPRRADLWRDVYVEHFEIHDLGHTSAEVTEGNPWPWPFGLVWERLRYDWSQQGVLSGTVIESNLFKPGSTWELRVSPRAEVGSRVEIIAMRHLRGRGWLLWPLFPLGLAKRDVASYLERFLSKVESARD